MTSIMDLIRPELSELSAPELENLPYLTLFTLQHLQIVTNQYQTWPQYIPIRSRISSIMGQMEPEHPELFALEFGKCAVSDIVYTLASTNINQSAPNLVKMYVTIRSNMSSIMDLIGPELSELFALEFAKIAESDFVDSLAFTSVDHLVPNMVTVYMTMNSWMSSIISQIRQ